jgi:hypothetical protein
MAEVIPKNHKYFLRFFSFFEKISPSCEISPEKKPTKSPNFRNFQPLIWLFAEIFPSKKQKSSKSLRKYVLSFFFPKLSAHTSFATNLVLEEEEDEEERRRLSSSLSGRQDDDRRRRRSRPAGRRRRRRKRRRIFEGGKWKNFPKCERISDGNK